MATNTTLGKGIVDVNASSDAVTTTTTSVPSSDPGLDQDTAGALEEKTTPEAVVAVNGRKNNTVPKARGGLPSMFGAIASGYYNVYS